jgi:signal recognition particle GTPase
MWIKSSRIAQWNLMKSLKKFKYVAQQIHNVDETEIFLRKDNAKNGRKGKTGQHF